MKIDSERLFLVGNATLFQATWFGCVLGGAAGEAAWGVLGLAALLAFTATRCTASDGYLALTLGIAGFGLDSLWIGLGVLDYGPHLLAPVWIVTLWLGLALTVNHSLGWLRGRGLIASALAALAAPFTYLAGERLGAVQVLWPPGLMVISAAWALLFWMAFSRRPVTASVPAGGAVE